MECENSEVEKPVKKTNPNKGEYFAGICTIIAAILSSAILLLDDHGDLDKKTEIDVNETKSIVQENNNIVDANNNEGSIFIDSTINYQNDEDTDKYKDATIYINGLDYPLDNIEEYQFFDEQSKQINTKSNYLYYDGYTGVINISNNNPDKEIILCNFRFVAENIIVDTMPILDATYQVYGSDSDYLCKIDVANDGWGNAKNIIITFEDSVCSVEELSNDDIDNNIKILDKILNEEDRATTISMIKSGTSQSIYCFPISNMNMELLNWILDEYGSFGWRITIYVQYEENNYERIPIGEILLVVEKEGISDYGGMGFNSPVKYAILIDTDMENYEFSSNINEGIPKGSTLELPICFFPNKSCSLTYYVEMEVFDGIKNYRIQSEKKDVCFKIHSYHTSFTDFCDAVFIKEHRYDKNFYFDPSYITFPYASFDYENNQFRYYEDIKNETSEVE